LRCWCLDETYVKVSGKWFYLYRATDNRGHTLNFYLSPRRNTQAAYRFLRKTLKPLKAWEMPKVINADKAPTYAKALVVLKQEGKCPPDVAQRQVKYLNNAIECDHGKLKRIINPMLGFKSRKTAYATIKGIETLRALRKGQAESWYYGHPQGEVRLVNRVFGL
jgi:IS6 family transposase